MHRNIDPDLLRTFLAIHATGSFSAAAAQVGRTQAAVSLQVKRLEELLGKPVLERNNRNVSLSTAGEILLEYAQRMIALNDEAFLRVSDNSVSGVLRLGAPEALTSTHLPEILALFNRNHPSVMLDVTCALTDELVRNFDRGDYDVVIFKRDQRSSRAGMTVYTENLVWAGGRSAPGEMSGTVPLILSPHPCLYRKRAIEWLERGGFDWRVVMTLHSLSGRISAVRAGLGLTLLPESMLDKTLRRVPFGRKHKPPGELELAIMGKKNGPGSLPSRFTEHVIHYFETL